jgi:hypothetical protein
MTETQHFPCMARPSALVFALGLLLCTPAQAYKTERVCETSEASLKAPAKKVCKTLLVMTEAQKAAIPKKEEKKVEKKTGH